MILNLGLTLTKITGNNAHKYRLSFNTFTFGGEKKVQPTSIIMYGAENKKIKMAIDTSENFLIVPSTQTEHKASRNDVVNYNGTITADLTEIVLNLQSGDNSPKVKAYQVDVSKIGSWTYSDTGILGLAPSSPYWGLIASSYSLPDENDYLTVALDLQNKPSRNPFVINDRDFSKSVLSVGGPNPNGDVAWYDDKRISGAVKEKINSLKSFIFSGVDVDLNKEEDKENYSQENICLLSDTNFFIAVSSEIYKSTGKKILKQLCGVDAEFNDQTQKWDKGCKQNDDGYKLKKVNPMSFRFKTNNNDKNPLFEIPVKAEYFLNIPEDKNSEIELELKIIDDNMIKKCGFKVDSVFGRQFLLTGKLLVDLKDQTGPVYRYGIQSKIIVYSAWLKYSFIGLTLLILFFFVILCIRSRKRDGDIELRSVDLDK